MIIYFADRQLNIIGQASTTLPKGLAVIEDNKVEDVETGVASFECKIPFDDATRELVEKCAAVGNHILRRHNNENELYSIIESESDTKKQQISIYAEDDGMDLLNEVVGAFAADEAHPIEYYINMYAADAGFEIGVNEAADLSRKLSWDGEATAAARIASVATQFDGCEISYTFKVDGLDVVKKYINIYRQRGQDIGTTLRLNHELDNIVTVKSIANLATALQCTGGLMEDGETYITLEGYEYDDGDFYVDGDVLKSRNALADWNRFQWKAKDTSKSGGHIIKQYSYDTLEQSTLCAHAITKLKGLREMEVNYEVSILRLPDNTKIGDRVNIVDEKGGLYLSARLLQLETSVTDKTYTAILGEHLLKTSGIDDKLAELAADFSKTASSAVKALVFADKAKKDAETAKTQANNALNEVVGAQIAAENATATANAAVQTAAAAEQAARNAQAVVEGAEDSIEVIRGIIDEAEQAASNAQEAVKAATEKSEEAVAAAANAKAAAAEASAAVDVVDQKAEAAKTQAAAAEQTSSEAKQIADDASSTAAAAKQDAENAVKDIDSIGERIETVSQTMEADYARKTDLTETAANLQTKISQNAAQILLAAARVTTINETANNAAEQAEQAQQTAQAAIEQAETAQETATEAEQAAAQATEAAQTAQNEADIAKAAAETARGVAEAANEELESAKADLATVSSRVGATEAEIEAAQKAVDDAQKAADKANEDAAAAAQEAANAQSKANAASSTATEAQNTANAAAATATAAQAVAQAAQGDASAAIEKANEAKETASAAQGVANTAKETATKAQTDATAAANAAAAAKSVADNAKTAANAAAADLETAKANLAEVTSRVGATEEEIAAAEEAVRTAQSKADEAAKAASDAQNAADVAQQDANKAQSAADEAAKAAENAQKAADDAQDAADAAQSAVDALAVRVITAETNITQNAEQIALRATKTEVAETLGGYYTKDEADAAISVKANEITSEVASKYTKIEDFAKLSIGGRNMLVGSSNANGWNNYTSFNAEDHEFVKSSTVTNEGYIYCNNLFDLEAGQEYTLSLKAKQNGNLKTSGADIYILPATYETTGIAANPRITDLTTSYKKYSFVITPNPKAASLSNCRLRIDNEGSKAAGTAAILYVKDIKLEKGNKATDWTPAPEDMATSEDVTQLSTRVTQTENSIKSQASSISSLGERMSTVEQTADGFTVELENLSVGGRNLIAGTSESEIYLGGYPMSSYLEGATGKTIGVPNNNEYVLSFNARSTVAGDTIRCFFYSPNTTTKIETSTGFTSTSADGHAQISLTASWKRYWVKYTQNGAGTTVAKSWIVGRRVAGEGSGGISISSIKLEEGNRATSWTPAPEDVDGNISTAQTAANNAQSTANSAQSTASTAVSDAASAQNTANAASIAAANAAMTATNFMSYDATNGLLIGNKSSGSWSGNRAQITSDAFNILNSSGAKLASFNSNTIELGKGCPNAVIDLCGAGTIQAYSTNNNSVFDQLTFKSTNFDFKGQVFRLTSTDSSLMLLSELSLIQGNNTSGDYVGGYTQNSLLAQSKDCRSQAYIGAVAYRSNYNAHVTINAIGQLDTDLSVIDVYPTYINVDTKSFRFNGLDINRIHPTFTPKGTAIAENSNLNTTAFLKIGNYYCSANVTAATVTNAPTTTAFMMQVYSPLSTTYDNESTGTWVYRLRKVMVYTGEEYTQYVYSGSTKGSFTYGPWKKVVKTMEAVTLDSLTVSNATNLSTLSVSSTASITGALTVSGNSRFTGNLEVGGPTQLSAIELYRATPYIDFHFNSDTSKPDYTLRLAEEASGVLSVRGNGVKIFTPKDCLLLYDNVTADYNTIFRPNSNGKCVLGAASYRWHSVYSANASIQTSDRREKENIKPLGLPEMMITDGETKLVDLHSELFDRLQPVQYNMIDGNGRICYGLIAQDVVESMREVGIGEDDLDLVHHEFWTDEESGDTKESYGLAYTNLIAMLIHEVQKLKAEIATMKG